MHDLLLTGGRVIDPANGIDATQDIAFTDGLISARQDRIDPSDASEVVDVTGKIVTPGLIDLHTHIYHGGTSLGIEPTAYAASTCATTLVDAGSAGPGNFLGFKEHVIQHATPRIYAYLNISFAGIYAFSQRVMVGECGDMRLLSAPDCLEVVEANRELIVGVKVRVGMVAGDGKGVAPLDIALEVAEEAGLPVMCHLDNPPPSRLEVVSRLRPGDILTHCFRPFPGAPARRDGRVHEEIIAARQRGVLFDIGHGKGSFGFCTAESMLAAGFRPDCISSDVHCLSIDGPAHDLLVTLSKLMHLGMSLSDVISAATAGPADAIGKSELGNLNAGTPADVSVLSETDGSVEFVDSTGEVRTANRQLRAVERILGGRRLL